MARARARQLYPQDWSQLAEIPWYPWRDRIDDWLEALEPGAPDNEEAGGQESGEEEVDEEMAVLSIERDEAVE